MRGHKEQDLALGPDLAPATPRETALDGLSDPIRHRDLFQTTVQRWFADPILTADENGGVRDRTMRTVFSHDHFGPSSIQQHGFYTALLIEPNTVYTKEDFDPTKSTTQLAQVCPAYGKPNDLTTDQEEKQKAEDAACATASDFNKDALQLATDDPSKLVGSHKRVMIPPDVQDGVKVPDPFHQDYREYALAIADFALLYDPRDRERGCRADLARREIRHGPPAL